MKSFRLTAALLIAAVTAFSAQAADKLIYMNDWLPGGDKALPYYAKERGFFTAEGLDVSIQVARGSSEAITRIATGAADVGGGGLAALLQARAQTSVPVTSIFSVFTKQPDAIFTVAGSSIKSLKDLDGKKVATGTFSSSNVVWPLILQAVGVDPAKVTLLKVDPAAMAPMLATGQVDATINWATNAPTMKKTLAAAGKELVILPWTDAGFEGYGYSFHASDKLIASNPDVVRRFVKAIMAAQKAAIADPKDVAKAMKAIFPEMDERLIEEQFLTIVPFIKNEISDKEGFGTIDKARLAKTWEWTAKSQNMALDKIDPETAVNRSFLPK